MNDSSNIDQQYHVNVHEPEKAGGPFVISIVPKGPRVGVQHCGTSVRAPQFTVAAHEENGALAFDWSGAQDAPGTEQKEIEAEIAKRLYDRKIWIDRVSSLVNEVERWAKELDWSTRRIEKRLEDPEIGNHRVPALIMQEETCRVLLEPVGRVSLGADGIVDLYLMPAYDDIASLYYYGGRWNLHYMFPHTKSVATIREADALPLSKETLEKVLAEMKQNAA